MLTYFVIFLFLSILALVVQPIRSLENISRSDDSVLHHIIHRPFFYFFVALFTIFIGLRYQVGGDFETYRYMYYFYSEDTFMQAIAPRWTSTDPGFAALNWIIMQVDPFDGILWNYSQMVGGYVLVNLLCGFIFSFTFLKLVFVLPRPFLALTIAFPYLILVVAIGYLRQGLALGFICYGFFFLMNYKKWSYVFCIVLASLFHKSAIVMLPLVFYFSITNAYLMVFISVFSLGFLILGVFFAQASLLMTNYIEFAMQSRGGQVRLLLSGIPALLYFYYRKQFSFSDSQHRIISFLSYGSIVLALLVIFLPVYSTALDRIGLYFLPIQMIIFSCLPDLHRGTNKFFINLAIILFYLLIMSTFLIFGDHSAAWIPYKNVLTLDYWMFEYPI
jgi:hypothetical protein